MTNPRRPITSLSASRKRPSTKARAGGLIPASIWVSIPYQEAARTVNPLVHTSVGSTPTWPTIQNDGCDAMAKRMKPLPAGTKFANGWRILEHWNCATSVEHGLGRKNSHYLCINDECGVLYAFENSNVRRWLDGLVPVLQKCKNCKGPKSCYYSSQNYKTISKEINREGLAIVYGKEFGDLVIAGPDYPSKLFTDHQRHVRCYCKRCKGYHFMRHDDLELGRLPCASEGRSMLNVPKEFSEETISP